MTANVLNDLPKRLQAEAKQQFHEIWMAGTRENAQKVFDLFVVSHQEKYPKTVPCLAKDRDVRLPSTTSRPSIEATCGPPTRSSRPSPRSAYG